MSENQVKSQKRGKEVLRLNAMQRLIVKGLKNGQWIC
jgi:hypothetical protein